MSVSPMVRKLVAAALLCLGGSATGFATDSFDGTYLTIPSLVIGTAYYTDVVVKPDRILSITGGAANGASDTYNPAVNELTIPTVVYGLQTYTNLTITVGGLVSIGSVTGADVFNGTDLLIPSVQVGGNVYVNVVVAVSASNVVHVAGQMPTAIEDQYDASSSELLIPAVRVGNKAYTNVTVTLAPRDVVSIGGGAPAESVLYSFTGGTSDGFQPMGLVQGTDGNLYGLTQYGGANDYGTFFRITPAGVETVLYSFPAGTYISSEVSRLFQGSDGNFYGTAASWAGNSCGAVFSATAGGAVSVLYAFKGNGDGCGSWAGVIQGSDGNFYGTTTAGGANNGGTVFAVTPQGVESVLYTFGANGPMDGSYPQTRLLQASDGNFYGTTVFGGSNNAASNGSGTIFKVTPQGVESVIHSFDAATANTGGFSAWLVQGADGNLYGTTIGGGAYGYGSIFQLTLAGVYSTVYSFGANGDDVGTGPSGGLSLNADGTVLYGVGITGSGSIFESSLSGADTSLHEFANTGGDAETAGGVGAVIMGSDGHLYGTTGFGGADGLGAVFKISL